MCRGLWRIRFAPLFRNACSCLRLCQHFVCVVHPARYTPSFPYPHWTYRTRSASTWRVSSHSLGAKISWSVVINICSCAFSMPERRKASAHWMLPTTHTTRAALVLAQDRHGFGIRHLSPAARLSLCAQRHWSATDTPPLMSTFGGACARLLRQLLSTLHLHRTTGFREVVSFPPRGFYSQSVSDMVQCSSSTRQLRQPLTSLAIALFCGCRVLKPSAPS